MSIKMIALEALKTKFEGIDEKVLSRIAAKIAKTAKNEEEANSAVEDMTLQGVIDAYTDSRVTDASDKAVKTYEEKHGLKDGKRVKKDGAADEDEDETDANGKKKPQGGDEMPAWAKTMMEELSALKGDKVASTRKSSLEKTLEGASDKMKAQIMREFGRAKFEDDNDFDGWLKDIEKDVKDSVEEDRANGGAGTKPKVGGAGAGKEINANVQARIDARKAETVAPAIQGLPTK